MSADPIVDLIAEHHVLVVREPIGEGHVPQYEVECPGVTDACRMWMECAAAGCPPFRPFSPEEDEALDNDFVHHGEEHRKLDGLEWCTSTDRCFLASYDELNDAVEFVVPGPGRFPVRQGVWQSGDDATVLRLELRSALAWQVAEQVTAQLDREVA